LHRAIELHLEHIAKCEEGWARYSYYRLGVLYEKTGNVEKATKYYQYSLKLYNGEWPSFQYRKGKIQEKGQGLKEKDASKANEHFKQGMELNVEFTLQLLFKKKCLLAFEKLNSRKMEVMVED